MEPYASLYLTKLRAVKPRCVRYPPMITKVSTVYLVFKPILLMLRIVGRFPYSADDRGQLTLRLCSGWVLHSVLVSALQWYVVAIAFNQISGSSFDSFNERVLTAIICLSIILQGLTPIAVFFEAPWLASYLDRWAKYQEELQLCKINLDTGLQKWGIFWVLFLIPVSSCLAFFQTVYLEEPLAFPIFLILQTSTCYIMLLWFTLLLFIQRTAYQLLRRLSKAVRSDEVARIRRLWVTLAELTIDVGSILGPSVLQIFIFCSLIAVANCFILLVMVRTSYIKVTEMKDNDELRDLLGHFVYFTCSVIAIAAICEAGHRCTVTVGSKFLKKILKINFSHWDKGTQRELRNFVHTIALRYPSLQLCYYFTINRRLLVSMTSAAITYLIVLIQFRTSES